MADKANRAARNRRVRQQALRDQLANQGHIQHVIDIVQEINDEDKPLDQLMIQRKKIVIDTKLKLINKYLPDVKVEEFVDETETQKDINSLSDEELQAIIDGKD